MEWNAICRVCLEGGTMKPLFEEGGGDTALSVKYNQCAPIEATPGSSMPEQICEKCVEDLESTFRFRTNCENSDSILKSFVVTIGTNSTAPNEVQVNSPFLPEVYNFQPPSGLQVRRIKVPQVSPTVDERDDPNMVIEYVNAEGGIDKTDVQSNGDQEDGETEIVEEEEESEEYVFMKDVLNDEYKSEVLDEEEPNESVYFSYTDQPDSEDKNVYYSEESEANQEVIKNNIDELDNVFLIAGDGQEPEDDPQPEVFIKAVNVNKARIVSRTKKINDLLEAGVDIDTSDLVAILPEDSNTLRAKRVINDPKPMKVCDICGNQYKYQHALESHLRRHRNDKPFTCNICGKGFVINFELNRHMRSHTGHKPYACKFCDRKFSDFGSRIKHERTHTGERPYTCDTCNKSFAYSHVLTSHMLTHTGIKKYHCTACGKRFAKSHHLKAHMNTHDRNILVRVPHATSTSNFISEDYDDDVLTIMPDEEDSQQDELRQYVIAKLDSEEKDSIHLIEFSPSDLVDEG